jgi:hypothetical protein
MKTLLSVILLNCLVWACASSRYIRDDASVERHKNIRGNRTANIVGDTFITTGYLLLSAIIGSDNIELPESSRLFRKITLHNQSPDTMIINMLTDYILRDSIYCDIMDMRIPPYKKSRLLLPNGALYNVYYSNTPEPDDDEMIQLDTQSKRKLALRPGMTKFLEE